MTGLEIVLFAAAWLVIGGSLGWLLSGHRAGTPHEIDVVKTLVDMPGYAEGGHPITVPKGSVGTVVLSTHEVEFIKSSGVPWAFAAYDPDQLTVKWRYLR